MPTFPPRVFLDANVIFSAALSPAGNARALFTLAGLRGTQLLTSRFAADEALRNIVAKNPQHVSEAESLLASITEVAEPPPAWLEAARHQRVPAKDAPILGAAMAHGADVLVTGDRSHFGHLYGKRIEGMMVASPSTAVRLLVNGWP
jgi:predicted nucleic acid-binding protein